MTDAPTASSAERFQVRVTADSHFAWLRTRLALERTMMAWQRTAVALIGFDFAIVEYFNHLQEIRGARPAYFPTAPEYLGARADLVRRLDSRCFTLAIFLYDSLSLG